MTDPLTRVLLVEPDDKEAARVTGMLRTLGGFSVARAATVREAAPKVADADVVVAPPLLPDTLDAAQTYQALCDARPGLAGPGIVALVSGADDALADVWAKAHSCVHGILIREHASRPDYVARVLLNAAAAGAVRGEPLAGRLSPAGPYATELGGVTLRLDRMLEHLQKVHASLSEQSTRLSKVESDARDRGVRDDRLYRTVRSLARRIRNLDSVVAGEPARGVRPLLVRLDDLERQIEANRHAAEESRSTARQAALQVLPAAASGVVAVLAAALAWFNHQTLAAHDAAHTSPPAQPGPAEPGRRP